MLKKAVQIISNFSALRVTEGGAKFVVKDDTEALWHGRALIVYPACHDNEIN